MVSFFVWNASKIAFVLPYYNLAIYWYSLFFALGLFGALLLGTHLLKARTRKLMLPPEKALIDVKNYSERLFFYLFIGILIVARLGHVLFYDLGYYKDHLLEICNLRQGGLSSHGGIIGLFIALYCFERNRSTFQDSCIPTWRDTLDLVAICSGWAAFCIRCGNFVNQEIIGNPSTVPWAIIFSDPVDGLAGVPRHPTQLYEAFVSLILLMIFLFMGRAGRWASNGKIAGLFLLLTFSARIVIEMLKAPQCAFDRGLFHMGQLLSLPLIIFGIYLLKTCSRSRTSV